MLLQTSHTMIKETKKCFSIVNNEIGEVTEDDNRECQTLLRAVDAFSLTTSSSLYVIDFLQEKIVYASKNIMLLCGKSAEEIYSMGDDFYWQYIPDADIAKIITLRNETFNFLLQKPIQERCLYRLSMDMHFLIGDDERLFTQCSVPLFWKEKGLILLLCAVSASAAKESGNAYLRKKGESVFYEFFFNEHKWKMQRVAKINQIEMRILQLSAQGYTMEQIAEKICKSVDSVKTYKRQLFKKTQSNNIAGTLMYNLNYDLL